MSEVKKLLHADFDAETYSYEIEETAEHLTVVRLGRGVSGGWKYEVTARRLDPGPTATAAAEVSGEGGDFATPDEAIAAARTRAQALLAAKS
jgi:hypothetical protein